MSEENDFSQYRKFELSDGTEVNLDEYKITRKEFREFYTGIMKDNDQIELFVRLTGLEYGYLENIPWMDWRLIVQNFRTLIERPLVSDPNSVSGSISD